MIRKTPRPIWHAQPDTDNKCILTKSQQRANDNNDDTSPTVLPEGSTSLRERLAHLSAYLAEERQQRIKARGQARPTRGAVGPEAEALQAVQKRQQRREADIQGEEIRSLRHELTRQRQEVSRLRSGVAKFPKAMPGTLDSEVEGLLAELQAVKHELVHREGVEQQAMQEAAQFVLNLELEMQNLTTDYEEAQVEIQNLRRMLQRRDAELQDESRHMEQSYREEVAALQQTLQDCKRQAVDSARSLSEARSRALELEDQNASLQDQLKESLRANRQLEARLQQSFCTQQEAHREREKAEKQIAALEQTLSHRDAEAEKSHATRDEAFLRLKQAADRKTQECHRLTEAMRDQRSQIDRLQQLLASSSSEKIAPSSDVSDPHSAVDPQRRRRRHGGLEFDTSAELEESKNEHTWMPSQTSLRELDWMYSSAGASPFNSDLCSNRIRPEAPRRVDWDTSPTHPSLAHRQPLRGLTAAPSHPPDRSFRSPLQRP